MVDRGEKLVSLVARMLRVYAIYQINEKFESFYKNIDESMLDEVLLKDISTFESAYREDIRLIALNSEDIVDGFDFEDEELMSALG